jgi:mRNA-degrading endonuclease RelE of RelBE toxin-antitoxin system
MAAGAAGCIGSSYPAKRSGSITQACNNVAARKLARCFAALEREPRSGNNVKARKGPLAGAYRYRVGDLRTVYTINEQAITVFVITIANRKDVYD